MHKRGDVIEGAPDTAAFSRENWNSNRAVLEANKKAYLNR